MNLFDSAFLCLDIGTAGVRGVAQRVRAGRIDRAAIFCVDDTDTVYAIKSVVDELERQIGRRLDRAYITGNLGPAMFDVVTKYLQWDSAHRITAADVRTQIRQISESVNGFYPMHIIPLGYDMPGAHDVATPVGHTDYKLSAAFGAIFYTYRRLDSLLGLLRRAHIQPDAFYDPMFLMNAVYRMPSVRTMFLDIGAEFTSISIWTSRGPVWHAKIPGAMTDIVGRVAEKFGIEFTDALRVVHSAADLTPREMDRFTPADTAFEFTRSDVGDVVRAGIVDIMARTADASKDAIERYHPRQICISGGGANIGGISQFIENTFSVPTRVIGADASVRALAQYIWAAQYPQRRKFMLRRRRIQKIMRRIASVFTRRRPRKRAQFIPVMPSTLCFDMQRDTTYSMFRAGGVSAIHVDIMDGLYVPRMAGSVDELRHIRKAWTGHLHVHLMTESPRIWAADAIAAGANTIIVSPNASGVRSAIAAVRAAGRRVGIALNPETPVTALRSVIRDVDEVMVMTVTPGAAAQEFNERCVKKIAILAATRKKYGLKFTISVDGGINEKTAPIVWAAGADMIVSGSYLANAPDFPIAVQSLLPGATKQENPR